MSVSEGVTPTVAPDALPPMDVAGRIGRLRDRFEDLGVDAMVVSNLTNVRYLSGFTGSAGALLVTADRAVFATDGRYRTQSAQQLADAGVDAEIEIGADAPDVVLAAATAGLARLGLEADSVTWSAQRRWACELFEGELVATTAAVEDLRLVKDPGEVARIRAACAIADAALAEVRGRLLDRPSEREFGRELDATMLDMGAEDLSFETIVASGANGALPHHHPGDRTVAEGDLVVIDFGALVAGYHSDMTRTVAIGELDGERTRMLEVVLAAQDAGVQAVVAGVDAVEVDRTCRHIIEEAGWGEAFVHGTGHGVGLDIHESPRVSHRSTAVLAAGHVVTVEPGVYLPDVGGVRVEDTVLVTAEGCERLTLAPKSPSLA